MSPDFFIIAIIFGSIVSIVFLGVIGSIIKAWIKRGSSKSLSENKDFLNALREYKENMEERVSELEAIVKENEQKRTPKKLDKKRSEKQSSIEIELEDEEKAEKEENQSSKLKNMLNQ